MGNALKNRCRRAQDYSNPADDPRNDKHDPRNNK
jgi:hypothetical protein